MRERGRVCMRERVREPVRGSENSAQAFPVFPLARGTAGPQGGGGRGREVRRGVWWCWGWCWGYNRQVTVRNSCGERLRLSLGVGQTFRQERGGLKTSKEPWP